MAEPQPPIRVLLVSDDAARAERIAGTLAAAGGDALCLIDHVGSIEAGLGRAADGVDVVVVETAGTDGGLLRALASLREQWPTMPVIVLAEPLDEGFALAAMRAGVMHCLPTEEALQPRVVPLIFDALRAAPAGDGGLEGSVSDAEFGTLHALCGPTPSPVSARSFGMRPLVEKNPDEFRDLARDYTTLLRRAIQAMAYKETDDIEPDLTRMVERLGILSAGPRDLIDMHKIAIAAIVGGEPPLRAKAFVEEGRLFLLRLMGYLVGFYRMLSWGRPAERPGRTAPRARLDPLPPRPSGGMR